MERPVVRDVRFFMAHTPGLVRHGYKATRETDQDPAFPTSIQASLRSFDDALSYAPHQVMLGNHVPDYLTDISQPWVNNLGSDGPRTGPHGELVPEEEFYGLLKAVDDFEFIWLEEGFASETQARLSRHPLVSKDDLDRIAGVPLSTIEEKLADGTGTLPLTLRDGRLIGLIRRRHQEDDALAPEILLENLCAKACATMSMRSVLAGSGTGSDRVQYLIGSGEEAIGDGYNRGGGNLAKAVAEASGCLNATGSDVKAFCSAPVHAMIMAGGLIASGVYEDVAVIGGCSLPKLGMKLTGHLGKGLPILEDVLVGFAILMGRDDGLSPVLRLDTVGRHTVGAGSSQQQIMEALVKNPLERVGLRFGDVDKYSTELHNPDITETVGTGNVPRTNYRIIAALAAQSGEIESGSEARDRFVARHGMPGFSPTQGHVASAMPYIGHALDSLRSREHQRAMFLAKGSLFLGRMTQLSDGVSFILEANPGQS